MAICVVGHDTAETIGRLGLLAPFTVEKCSTSLPGLVNHLRFICNDYEHFHTLRKKIHMLNQSLYEFLKDLKQKKFNTLIQEQRPSRANPQTVTQRNIVHTIPDDLPLTNDERSVLNKGLKFIPRKPTIDEFQAKHDAEAFFRRLRLKVHFHNQQPDADEEDSPSPEVDAIDSLFPKKSTWTPRPGEYSALDLYIDKSRYEISKINFLNKNPQIQSVQKRISCFKITEIPPRHCDQAS